MIPLAELIGYEKNSKIHTRENIDAIKASIGSFGMCDPLKVWKNAAGGGSYIIVEGHGTKQALEELGYEEAPCIVLDHLDDEERRALVHVLNQTTLMTPLDYDILLEEFADLPGFDFEDFGFEHLNIDWDNGLGDLDEENYEEPEKPMLVCPCCGHKDSKERFKKADE